MLIMVAAILSHSSSEHVQKAYALVLSELRSECRTQFLFVFVEGVFHLIRREASSWM